MWYTDLNRHVERYRHDSVHDDGVGEEDEQRDDERAPGGLGRHQRVPRQEGLEVAAHQPLPHAARHRAEHAHRQQEEYYLWDNQLRVITIDKIQIYVNS